jgi:uncharacterized protein (DUF1697 family)
MPRFISLLRGINVGGNKIIKMADLKALYAALGFTEITTLLQSGNVVFNSDAAPLPELTQKIETAIVATYGFDSKIILRTPEEWRSLMDEQPFTPEQMQDPSKVLVWLLQAAPDSDYPQSIIAQYSGVEQMMLRHHHLYVYYAEGMGKSKLDNAFVEKKLKLIGTARNWNTIQKIAAVV